MPWQDESYGRGTLRLSFNHKNSGLVLMSYPVVISPVGENDKLFKKISSAGMPAFDVIPEIQHDTRKEVNN